MILFELLLYDRLISYRVCDETLKRRLKTYQPTPGPFSNIIRRKKRGVFDTD